MSKDVIIAGAEYTGVEGVSLNATDGSKALFLPSEEYLKLTGGTLTGSLILNAAPDSNMKAANKAYVDQTVNGHAQRTDNPHSVTAAQVGAAPSSHNHSASQIPSGTLGVARGGTGTTTFTSGAARIGNGTGAVTTRRITNNTSTSSGITANTNLITANTLRYALNRTTSVAAADTGYTTYMARGMSLNSSEATPSVNGAIAWQYE